MADTLKNSAENGAEILKSFLSASSQSENAQAKFVIYMFHNEVSYTYLWAKQFKSADGKRKTELTDETLSDVSDDYSAMLDKLEALKEKRDRSKNDNTEIESLNNKIRSAREMFKRAVAGLYYLRAVEAKSAKLNTKNGNISFMTEDDEGNDNLDMISGRALTSRGEKRFASDTGKDTSKADKKVKINGTETTSRIFMAQEITKFVHQTKDLDDLPDNEHKAITDLFLALMTKHFSANNTIILEEVGEFVRDNFKDKGVRVVNKPMH